MVSESDLSRRRVLGGALGAGVAVVAGVGGYIVASNSPAAKFASEDSEYGGAPTSGAAPATTGSGRPLAALSAIPDGGGIVLSNPNVVLTRSGSTVNAFSSICTHQGCPVNAVRDGKILCPCHGSQFDASTGAVVGGPAPRPLPRVAIIVVKGEVMAG
jgi:Rieske Fe-S protein